MTNRPHPSQSVPSAHHPRTDEKASAGGFTPPADATQKKAASYSPASHRSTIGAGGLNFSVRNGKRWDPAAITTKCIFSIRFKHTGTRQAKQEAYTHGITRGPQGGNTPLRKRSRAISSARLWRRRLYTCALSTSSSRTALDGALISRMASHLDAFSAYPNRTRVPSGAPGGTTGSPEVRPPRSSRTSGRPAQNSYAHDR